MLKQTSFSARNHRLNISLCSLASFTSIMLISVNSAFCAINPNLQPIHLYERYNTILTGTISSVDTDNMTLTLDVDDSCKNKTKSKKITVSLSGSNTDETIIRLRPGKIITAYTGKKRRRHEKDILFFTGSGRWHTGELIEKENMDAWTWHCDEDEENEDSMFATFNGTARRLFEMMSDTEKGRAFFPARPFVKFNEDILIDKLPSPVRAVAIYDINNDGMPDIYACSKKGNRAYLQVTPMKFKNSTKELKLDNVKSTSCSFADVNADGKADLLAGGTIYLASNNEFTSSKLLPSGSQKNIKCSSFADINSDGYPDVVISRIQNGLELYLNPGKKGGAFQNATKAALLSEDECGAQSTGYFTVGDWNNDGYIDLFYSVGKGLLLLQDKRGCFKKQDHNVSFSFISGDSNQTGNTGAGCFATVWKHNQLDIITPMESSFVIAINQSGKPRNMARYFNELSETTYNQLACIAEDLNADGLVDLYTISSSQNKPNVFHTNRGYGSFMRPQKYSSDLFRGEAHKKGALGVAAGDINGDGVNDLLIGNTDGELNLIINDTLSLREEKDHPLYHEKKLQDTSIVSIHIKGERGVLGAKILLKNASGDIKAMRQLGSNIATGCRGPDTVNLAVREPGAYTLTVIFSDGFSRDWKINIGQKKLVQLKAQRE